MADLWQLSPESQMDPWLFSVQAPGTPSDVDVLGLDLDLSLCTEPCSLPSHCLQHPGQASCLCLLPFQSARSAVREKLSGSTAEEPSAGMRQFNSRKKINFSPKCSGESCVDELCSADDWCVSSCLQFCLHLKNLWFCTEAEFA